MGNIVQKYELSLSVNEQRKVDAMIDEQNLMYNVLLAKSLKIYRSKVSKDVFCRLSKEDRKIVNERKKNVLLFVNKKGQEVRGFSKFSLIKMLQELFPDCLVDSATRNYTICEALWSAWDKFFSCKSKSFPKFKSSVKGNTLDGFSTNYGAVNYRQGKSAFTYIIDKESNSFCLNFNAARCKNTDSRRKVCGHFRFRTNKGKGIGFRDNKKKCEYFDKDLDVCTFGIHRKEIRGKKRYYLYVTYDIADVEKQPIDEKLRIGIDPNMKNFAVYSSQSGCMGLVDKCFDAWLLRAERKMHKYERRLSVVSEKANPESYFKADGTRRARMKRLSNVTDEMRWLRKRIKVIMRRKSEYRNNVYGMWANLLVNEHPSVIKYEDISVKGMQAKSQEGMGKRGKKKRFGKSILDYAPSTFKGMLVKKCNAKGINFVEVSPMVGCTRFDCTDGLLHPEYAKLRNRVHSTSDGIVHSRDLMSAYNISCCDERQIDVALAKRDYAAFCQHEKIEMKRLVSQGVGNGLI